MRNCGRDDDPARVLRLTNIGLCVSGLGTAALTIIYFCVVLMEGHVLPGPLNTIVFMLLGCTIVSLVVVRSSAQIRIEQLANTSAVTAPAAWAGARRLNVLDSTLSHRNEAETAEIPRIATVTAIGIATVPRPTASRVLAGPPATRSRRRRRRRNGEAPGEATGQAASEADIELKESELYAYMLGLSDRDYGSPTATA